MSWQPHRSYELVETYANPETLRHHDRVTPRRSFDYESYPYPSHTVPTESLRPSGNHQSYMRSPPRREFSQSSDESDLNHSHSGYGRPSSSIQGYIESPYNNSHSAYEDRSQQYSPSRHVGNTTQRDGQYQASGLRRGATRKVRLVENKVLSVDYPMPSAICNSLESKYRFDLESGAEEFSHMRYTAATCDPSDFTLKNGYNLRPCMYNRHSEVVIAITVYNEGRNSLARSLHAVMSNIKSICELKKSEFWNKGGPAWQKIVVVILIDGIATCDPGILDLLATIGVYQDGIMKKDIDGKQTIAHIFECTTQLSVSDRHQLHTPKSGDALPPIQLIACLKTHNSRKINSHRWLYTGFGRLLNPEVVVCLDVGTKPKLKSVLALWEAFYNDKDLGGACGNVSCSTGRSWIGLLNPLVAAQNFEYKVSYQLDRAVESISGYISVLPGAYCAFRSVEPTSDNDSAKLSRFRAIMGPPLEQYFHGDPTLEKILGRPGLFQQNLYLAEDRILCLELIVKAGSKWHLNYVKAAQADTDVPDNMVDFILQRRRWLNGSFAATLHSIPELITLYKSGHNIIRLPLLIIQFLYNILYFLLSWFSLAAFLLTLFIVNEVSGDPPAGTQASGFPFGKATPVFNAVLQAIYVFTVVAQFVLALGTRPKAARWSYLTSFAIFGIVQFYFLMNVVYLFKRVGDVRFKDSDSGAKNYEYINMYYSDIGDLTIIICGTATFGVYVAVGFLHLDPWHIFTSYAQYLFVVSSYTNILNIYAFSNFDDHSWGHKSTLPEPLQNAESAITKTTTKKEVIVEEVEKPQKDIDAAFEETVRRTLQPSVTYKGGRELSLEDKARMFKIRLLGVYIFSNFLLCIIVLNDSFKQLYWLGDSYWHKIWFFRIWLWLNAGCLYFRFLGSCIDLVRQAFSSCVARR